MNKLPATNKVFQYGWQTEVIEHFEYYWTTVRADGILISHLRQALSALAITLGRHYKHQPTEQK
jgi:hypothetical protein